MEIRMPDWRDPWINVDQKVRNTPSVITNAFVRSAILVAIERGFELGKRGRSFVLIYTKDGFAAERV